MTIYLIHLLQGTAQRFALHACGRAWKLFGSRKKLEATRREMLVNRIESPASSPYHPNDRTGPGVGDFAGRF